MATALALTAVCAGCGFQPIHGDRSRASAAALEGFDIELIPDRSGQLLRTELLQRFRPRGETGPARFTIRVGLSESLQNLAVRIDDTATRANLRLRATFSVVNRADRLVYYKGVAQSVNSYNILTSDFATLSARADARRRGVRELANDIKERISVWLFQTGGARVEPTGTSREGNRKK